MIDFFKRILIKKSRLLRSLIWLSYNLYDDQNHTKFRKIGKDCVISNNAFISHKNRLTINNNVKISKGCILNCQGGLSIGNNVGIAVGSIIWTVEHAFRDGVAIPYGPDMIAKPVLINDNVWIGANSKISPGVEIGEGAIVGMASFVTKDVPACAIVLGNPARIVGYRDKDQYEKCKAEGSKMIHKHFAKVIIPKYIQNRPNLLKIVKQYIENKEMVLEE